MSPSPAANRLLDALPRKLGRALAEECERVELSTGDILYQPGERIRDVYFPIECFISLIAVFDTNASLEIALVGNEGMLGIPLILGVEFSSLRALVQGPGAAWRMPATHFRRLLSGIPHLRRGLDGYVCLRQAQLAQTAACTCFHLLEGRLACWLLRAQDRAHMNCFHITHSQLAQLLGVRRSGVTIAAGVLQRAGLIHYSRGDITIIDRKALERVSCGCYAADLATYKRLARPGGAPLRALK